jgi:predicted Zn-dependent protease
MTGEREMTQSFPSGRINVKVLVILVAVTALLMAGAAGGYKIRKRILANRALAAGKVAMEQQNWPEACKQLRLYLSKYPENTEMLARYAEANLAVRPTKSENFSAAMSAYRRLLRIRPGDERVSHELAKLYMRVGDANEAAHICNQRLEVASDDYEARLTLAKALAAQRQPDDATSRLEMLLEKRPQTPEAYSLLAGILQQEGAQRAVELASRLVSSGGSATSRPARELSRLVLDLGVQRNPDSALLLAQRARLMRLADEDTDVARKNLGAARKDLEAADALRPANPSVLFLLTEEWAEQPGDGLDRAAAELKAIEQLDAATLAKYGFQADELKLPRFSAEARLGLRKGARAEGVALADRALKELQDDSRLAFMPSAVDLYLADGRIDSARRTVEEYRQGVNAKVVISEAMRAAMRDTLTFLEAVLASAENKPYDVIDKIKPLAARKPDDQRIWRMLIPAYRATGQGQQALRALEECATRWPRDATFASELAKACMVQGRWSDALRYAQTAEQAEPNDLGATLLRLQARINVLLSGPLDSNAADQLERELAELSQDHPRVVEIRTMQAAINIRRARVDAAVAGLEKAVQECDRPLPAARQLAECYMLKNEPDKAIGTWKAAVEKNADVAAPRLALAELQLRIDRANDARATLEQAVATLGGDEKAKASMVFAQFLLLQNQRPQGIELLKQLAVERPADAAVRRTLLQIPEVLADTQQSQKLVDELKAIETDRSLPWRLEQARVWLRAADRANVKPEERQKELAAREQDITQILNQCIEAEPTWAQPVIVLGVAYETLGKDDRAEEAYRRLLQVQPGQIDVADRLIGLLLRQRRFTAAADILKQVPERLRDLTPFKRQRMSIAIGDGDLAAATKDARELVAADPKDAASRVMLARLLYADKKDTKEALKLLDEARALAPDLLSVVSTRAEILHAESRDPEALAVLDAEVKRRDDFATRLLRAQFYATTKQYDHAEADYVQLTKMKDASADGYELLGMFYANRGDLAKAIATWDAGLKANPEAVSLQRALARTLLLQPDAPMRDRGRALLDDLLTKLPNDTELLALRADVSLTEPEPGALVAASGDLEQALERAVQRNPGDLAVHLRLIQLARARGDVVKASDRVTRALGSIPGNPSLALMQAVIESDRNNTAGARELAESLRQRDPKNSAVRGFLVDLDMRTGQFDSALALNKEALDANPSDESAWVARARILNAKGQRAEAIRDLASFCKSESGRERLMPRLVLAELYRMADDFPASQSCIDEAAKLAPDGVEVFIARLQWFAAQKQYDRVRTLLAERHAKTPRDFRGLLVGAGILMASGDELNVREARKTFEHVTEAAPNLVDGLFGLAQACYVARDLEGTVVHYRRILQIVPYHSQALNDLAWILGEEMGKPQEALEYANKGVARYPKDPHLLDTRGVLLARLGRLAEAQQDLEGSRDLAADIPSTKARASLHLARVLAKRGDRKALERSLDLALKTDKEHRVFTDAERAEIAQLMPSR